MRPFADLLTEAIERAGTTKAAFARTVNQPRSTVTDVVAGRRAPPMAHVERWAEALNVPAAAREEWRRAAGLAHAHPVVQEWVQELESQGKRLQSRLEKVTSYARGLAEQAGVPFKP